MSLNYRIALRKVVLQVRIRTSSSQPDKYVRDAGLRRTHPLSWEFGTRFRGRFMLYSTQTIIRAITKYFTCWQTKIKCHLPPNLRTGYREEAVYIAVKTGGWVHTYGTTFFLPALWKGSYQRTQQLYDNTIIDIHDIYLSYNMSQYTQ